MLEKSLLTREFVIEKGGKKITLPDPDCDMTPDQVRKFYIPRYSELLNGSVVGPEYKGDKMVYSFKTTVGTKG